MFATASPTVTFGRELAWWLLAGVALYFAPTMFAIARHRGAAPLTFYVNLLLGWTGLGWLMAWLVAFSDRRVRINVTSSRTPSAAMGPYPWQMPLITLAPDGRHWWNGSAWRDGWQVAPVGALRSPDGSFWFTGVAWVPVPKLGPRSASSDIAGR